MNDKMLKETILMKTHVMFLSETYENVFPTKDVQHDSGWCFQVTMCYPAINSNIITIYF